MMKLMLEDELTVKNVEKRWFVVCRMQGTSESEQSESTSGKERQRECSADGGGEGESGPV